MPQATAVARAFGARLTVLHVLEPPHDDRRATLTDPLDWEVQRTEAQRHLESLRSEYSSEATGRAGSGPIDAEVLEGRPAESIQSWARTNEVDLTVLTSHGQRGRTDWMLAGTARKLVEGVPGSLLLVPARPGRRASSRPVKYERILVPLDGSARAENALAVARQIAMSEVSELLLLHVVSSPPHPCPYPFDEAERDLDRRLVDRNLRAATAYLEGIARRIEANGILVRTLVAVERDVRDEIRHRIAVDEVDLVVLSGHGHSGRTEQAVGTVAGFLLEQVSVPLLVVRDAPPTPAPSPDRRDQTGVRLPHVTDD